MIIPKPKHLSDEQLGEVQAILASFGCTVQPITGAHRSVYAILGDERSALMVNRIEGLDYIDRVDLIESPYKLMDRRSDLAEHHFAIGPVTLGESLFVIAGPCTVDPRNPSLTVETAHALKEAGANALRGGVWKPRTMPYSYQGEDEALDVLLEARRATGLPINLEVMDARQLEIAMRAEPEIVQIGARNALNYSLLKAVGEATAGARTAVLLKRGRHIAPVDEFISAAEYIAAAGNADIMLCPRGTMPTLDGYRSHPDESITPLLRERTWAPVVVDPCHSVGRGRYVPACALAAIAYGADGLCLEAHVDPAKGIGDDPRQAITPESVGEIVKRARTMWDFRGLSAP